MRTFWIIALVLMGCPLFLQAAPSPALFTYSGTLSQLPERNNGTMQEVKRFKINALVEQAAASRHAVRFLVQENGGGGWHWAQQFGKFEVDQKNKALTGQPIQLLNRLEESDYAVSMRSPWFEYPEKLQEEAVWEAGKNQYSVTQKKMKEGKTFWKVHMQHRLGRHQDLTIDEETSLITAARQTVFMGQGVKFYLDWKLESQTELSAVDWSEEVAVWDNLNELRESLELNLEEPVELLEPEKLELVQSALPELKQLAAETLFTGLVRRIGTQTRYQQERSKKLMDLSEKYVGQPAPEMKLISLKQKRIAASEYDKKPVVLHFWKYHKEALKAPYGQVGYLDFLYNKKENSDVKVYGVAVSSGLNNPKQKRATLLKIRKMIQFMNLSYPIAYDDGSLLRELGNPERSGGVLPLWVVIDPQGKIAHYQAGLFEVQPNEGLKQLDQLLAKIREDSAGSN